MARTTVEVKLSGVPKVMAYLDVFRQSLELLASIENDCRAPADHRQRARELREAAQRIPAPPIATLPPGI
jgi:hypothetical protein